MATMSEILNRNKSEVATPEVKASIGTIDEILSRQDTRTAEDISAEQQERLEALPELTGILAGQDKTKAASLAPVLLTTTNPQEFGQILESSFPDIGITQTPEGEFIAVNNKTGAAASINKPGLSKTDILQAVGIGTAFFPAGKLAAGASSIPKAMATGGLGAAATQAPIEVAQAVSGGEFDPADIAISGSLGVGAEVLLPAAGAVKQAITPARKATTETGIPIAKEAVKGLEEATGESVGLFKGQQTQVPTDLLEQRLLTQITGSTKKATEALKKQNEEVFNATTKLIDSIGGENALSSGAANFKTASQKALDNAKQIRKEKASPFYKEAFKEGADVNLMPISDVIENSLSQFPKGGKISSVVTKAANLIDNAKNLKQLHGAKLEIDSLINGQGEAALDNTAKRELVEIQKTLLNQMDEASPLYSQARETFKNATPEYKSVADSVLGKVSRIKDDNLKQVARTIFDAQEVNPEMIKNTKALISEADPNAWNDILRVELQRRIGGMSELITDNPQMVSNTPAQLKRALFGNPAQRKVLMSGMNANQRANFRYLEDVLGLAATGRQAGSPTAPFEAIKDKLRGTSLVIKDFVFSPMKTIAARGEESIVDRNAAALAEAAFNPAWADELAKIRTRSQNTSATARALTQLLDEVSMSLNRTNEEQIGLEEEQKQ